jgi:nitrile hydratase subunit beta
VSFHAGDPVRVRRAFPPGHVRTPYYTRGHRGTVVEVVGAYPNPERLAYGLPGEPAPTLYRVRFAQAELWPDYAGDPADSVDVEIFEHWLESA